MIRLSSDKKTRKNMLDKSKAIHRFPLLYIWRCVVFFHHVPPKMPGAFAREVALAAFVGLLSSVIALVLF